MGLRDIVIKRAVVELGDGQNFSVRGLSAMDVMALVQSHGAALGLAYGKIKAEGGVGTLTADSVRNMLISVGSDFPQITAAIIALAADAYDEKGMDVAAQIPFVTQATILQQIFFLSFTSETEVKKLIESVSGVVLSVATTLNQQTMTSLDGISESDAA